MLGLVGESGCGKTTTGRCILRLIEPTAGSVRFEGREITTLAQARAARAAPRDADRLPGPVLEPQPAAHRGQHARPRRSPSTGSRAAQAARERVAELLTLVGLSPDHARRYPHEFSGGQRQRIGVARALAVEPQLIVADEPVSALDVSIQAQIINLLRDLQRQMGLTYLFIAHDLSVVEHISDRVAVMYLGKIVELADERRRSTASRAIPTRVSLLSAIPVPDPDAPPRSASCSRATCRARRSPPSGCRFHPRCFMAQRDLRARGAAAARGRARPLVGVPLRRGGGSLAVDRPQEPTPASAPA